MHDGTHRRRLFVGTIEQLDPAILLLTMLPIERQQMIPDLLHPLGRRQRIEPSIEAEMPAGNDQFIDLRRLKMLE